MYKYTYTSVYDAQRKSDKTLKSTEDKSPEIGSVRES